MSAPNRRIWIDGRLVPWAEATVHVLSHSHQRGSLVFDYMSVHETPRGPAVFRLDDHVRRFLRVGRAGGAAAARRTSPRSAPPSSRPCAPTPGAKAVKIERLPGLDRGRRRARRRARDPRHRRLRSPRRHPAAEGRQRPGLRAAPHLDREGAPQPAPGHHVAPGQGGRELRLADGRRSGRRSAAATTRCCSSTSRASSPRAPTSNVFLVDRDGVLRTPPEETVLLGVTRRSILEIAKSEGRKVVEEKFRPAALFEAAGGLPHRHDRRRLGRSSRSTTTRCRAAPGPVTQAPRRALQARSPRARIRPSSAGSRTWTSERRLRILSGIQPSGESPHRQLLRRDAPARGAPGAAARRSTSSPTTTR